MNRGWLTINACRWLWLMGLLLGIRAGFGNEERAVSLRGGTVVLQDVSAQTEVRFQSLRLNRALNVWNVEATVRNTGTNAIKGPLVLSIEGFSGTSGPLQPDGQDSLAHPCYDLSTNLAALELAPGAATSPRTLSLALGAGAPLLTNKVFAAVPATNLAALAVASSLNAFGQPLMDVVVEETGPAGPRLMKTDNRFGLVTLGVTNGLHQWRFSKVGYLPAWRESALTPAEIALLPSPRLTQRSAQPITLTPLSGEALTNADGTIRLAIEPGQFAQETTATLTALNGQNLPGFLPLGWSPLAAFWLELAAEPVRSISATLIPWGPISPGESAILARWNAGSLRWDILGAASGNGTNGISLPLPGSGAFVLVVADTGEYAPPAAQIGQPLAGVTSQVTNFSRIYAGGRVVPSTIPASKVPELVTATGQATFTNQDGALPSGLLLRSEITERYLLQDQTRRNPPRYTANIVAYQRPGDQSPATVGAAFPLRPLLLYGADELLEGRVTIDILEPGRFTGGILETNGGVVASDGVAILASVGDLAGRQAVQIRRLEVTNFLDLAVAGSNTVVLAFELGVGEVVSGRRLRAQLGTQTTNSYFVLARVLSYGGVTGLEPVERFISDATGALSSAEPATGERLPGITGAGQYLLLKVGGSQALILGVARNTAGQPAENLVVRTPGQPWMTLSAADGAYRLIGPVGNVAVSALDLTTGDFVESQVAVAQPQTPVALNLSTTASGPRVAEITPANGAKSIPRVTAVVVRFSEPINPGTLAANGIELLGTNGQPVAASLNLNLRNTIATLLPTAPLTPSSLHTVRISTNVTDLTGARLEGTNLFTFTTASDELNRAPAQLYIYEPTNGLAAVFGTPGTADAEVPVILVNETSGRTATILSKPDGSFTNFLEADVDDFLSAVLVNQNGTRTTVPASRQIFRDGSVGLYNGGGILEAQSDGGPVNVLVEPGAVPNKTRFKLSPLLLNQVLALINNTPPESGRIIGGFSYEEKGDELKTPPDVEYPVNPASLGLSPGVAPEDAAYGLTVPHNYDGLVVYEIVDRMKYENGKLVTHSPPFPGMDLRGIIRSMANSRRGRDYIQEKISEVRVGLENGLGLMFTVAVLGEGQPVTLRGTVISQRVGLDGKPKLFAREKPVAGAVVILVRDNAFTNSPGKLLPGQFVAITDEEGKFALNVPPDAFSEPTSYTLRASHPRFPALWATATVTREANAASPTAGFRLFFPELDVLDYEFPDTAKPFIYITQDPENPKPGANGGATLKITVIDDRKVNSIDVQTNSIVAIGLDLSTNQVLLTAVSSQDIGANTKEKIVKLTSELKARVTVNVKATDDTGNIREVDYEVFFSGEEAGPPAQPSGNDITPPRVVSVWPPDGATSVQPGAPIRLRFSEPVAFNPVESVMSFSTQHKLVGAVPSADYKEYLVTYSGPLIGTVTFTLNGSSIRDLAGNRLVTASGSSFTASFDQVIPKHLNLTEVRAGGGVVQKGNYAYALDRDGDRGKLWVFSLTNNAPVKVGSLDLPSYPRDLALIPNYSFRFKSNDTQCVTNDLLAVVGGRVGSPTSDEGSFYLGQYLWIINITDPTKPVKLSNCALEITRSIAAVPKIKWVPPHLAYLEFGPDVSSVGLVNLPALIVGFNSTAEERAGFAPLGFDGVDLNGDGDFCDTNEFNPTPVPIPTEFFGKEYSFTAAADAGTTNAPLIVDFDFESGFGLLGMIMNPATASGTAKYQTVYSAAGFLDPEDATYEFPQSNVVRRVFLLTGVRTEDPGTGNLVSRNLALVSVLGEKKPSCSETGIISGIITQSRSNDCPAQVFGSLVIAPGVTLVISNSLTLRPGGAILNQGTIKCVSFANLGGDFTGNPVEHEESPQQRKEPAEQLYVIDITDPLLPHDVNILSLPKTLPTQGSSPVEIGRIESIQRRADGLLALATDNLVLLVNPAWLLRPQRPDSGSFPPAIVGVIDQAGGGARSFVAASTGQNLINLGGRHELILSKPYIDLIFLGATNWVKPQSLATSNETYQAMVLDRATSPSVLLKTRFIVTNNTLAATPPSLPYYVRLDINGDAGSTIDLVLESLDAQGVPFSAPASNAIPVRLAPTAIRQALLDTNPTPYQVSLTAYRLSSDPRSDLYHRYFAGPILMAGQSLSDAQRAAVISGIPVTPAILRPGRYLWAGISPSVSSSVVTSYVSRVSSGRLVPGVNVRKEVEKERAPVILIPGMAATRLYDLTDPPYRLPSLPMPLPLYQALMDAAHIKLCQERWIGIRASKEELSLSPYYTNSTNPNYHQFAPYDVIRYIPEALCGAASVWASTQDHYGPLIDRLVKEEGYVEYLYTNVAHDCTIESQFICQNISQFQNYLNNVAPSVPTLFIYPYDWRFNNTNAAAQLTNLVAIVKRFHPEAEKVTLLAHSMGGLVARRFALDHPELVEKVVTVGTPWLGTPKAINVTETGDFGISTAVIDHETLRKLAEYFPSAHQLMPSSNYFAFGARPIREVGYDLDGNGRYNDELDYAQFKRMMDARFHCDPTSRPIGRANEPFHTYANNAQDDWRNDTAPIRYYHLYGVQSAPMTINKIITAGRLRQVIQTNNNLRLDLPEKYRKPADAAALHPVTAYLRATNYWIIEKEFFTERGPGDQTVTELSLSRKANGLNFNRPDARLLPFYSTNIATDARVEHTRLLHHRQAQDAIVDILEDLEPAPSSLPIPAGNVVTWNVHIKGLSPGSQLVNNGAGETTAPFDFSDTFLARAIQYVGGSVGSVYQWWTTTPEYQVAQFTANMVTSAYRWMAGVDYSPLAPDTIEYELVGTKDYTVSFKTTDDPVAVTVTKKNNGTAQEVYVWNSIDRQAGDSIDIAFTVNGFNGLQNGTQTLAPDYGLSGAGYPDYTLPTLTFSTNSTGVIFTLTDNQPNPATSNFVFVAQDIDGDGDVLDEHWVPLTNTPPTLPIFDITNTPGVVFYAIGRDASGNLSQPVKVMLGTEDNNKCDLFTLERNGVLEIIRRGIIDATNSGWLLNTQHLSLLEQGSGACLWADNFCVKCNGVYTPGKSDHDFELFLPVQVPAAFPVTIDNAYTPAASIGNWYHKPPRDAGGSPPYHYPLPPGFTGPSGQTELVWNGINNNGTNVLADTPAQIIARLFDVIRQEEQFIAVLPDVSFFPERREHFEAGILHLNRPPNEGDDPLGDAALGRQMLLLKWLLEGRYVPGYDGLDLDLVYRNMTNASFATLGGSQHGIPSVEGLEWGNLQEHTALKGGILLRIEDMGDPAEPNPKAKNFLYDTFAGQVKKAGKGAIRTALASIVGRAGGNLDKLFISRAAYTNANNGKGYPAYEDYIADMATNSQYFANLFPNANDRDLIAKAALAKVAEPAFMKDLLADDCKANAFLADAYKFIRLQQANCQGSYDQYMQFMQTNGVPNGLVQYTARNSNMVWLVQDVHNPPSLTNLRSEAFINLVVRVFNQGPDSLQNVDVSLYVDGVSQQSLTNNLAPYQMYYRKGESHHLNSETPASFYISTPYVTNEFNKPHVVDIVVSAPGRAVAGGNPPGGSGPPYKTDWEPNPCDNWIRFRYYLFDINNPCPPLPLTPFPPPPKLKCEVSDLCPGNRNRP